LSFAASLSLLLNSFALHTTVETFLVTTILTTIPLLLVDDTIAILSTCIRKVLADGALKEAFAALATVTRRVESEEKETN